MADKLLEYMYSTRDANGDIRAPPSASQFEDLYNLVNELLLKVDGDQTTPMAPNKQHNLPSVPATTKLFRAGAWTSTTPRMYLLI
jgi:hypothetical protein